MKPAFVRFSALDRMAVCPSTLVESEGKPNLGNDNSALGTAVHAAFAQLVTLRDPAKIHYDSIARVNAVSADDIREIVVDSGYVPPEGSEAEVKTRLVLGDFLPHVEGTADLVIATDCSVTDFKVSQLRDDAPDIGERLQVLGYAASIALERNWFGTQARIFNPLMGNPRGFSKLDVDPDKILDEVRTVVLRAMEQYERPVGKREYRPGVACTFCPGRSTCPAANAALTAIVPVIQPGAEIIAKKDIPAALLALRDIKKRIEAFEDAVGLLLETEGRIVSDGLVAERRSRFVRPSRSFKKAMEKLREDGKGEIADELEHHFDGFAKIEQFYRFVGASKETSNV